VLKYYRERREKLLVVTKRLLVAYWRRLDPVTTESLSEDAALQRMKRFMERHGLVNCKKTNTAQRNCGVRGVMDDFVQYIQWKKEVLGITDDGAVVNGDETNVYFSPSFEHTIAERGSRTVTIRETNSSNRCTAMLCVAQDGTKLEPYIIHTGKPTPAGKVLRECLNPQDSGYPEGMVYMAQESAWMDEPTMLDWVERVWKPYASRINGPKLLILDSCTSHLTPEVRRKISNLQTELEVIPPGYTGKLQPLDVGLNKPFKDRVRHEVERFLTEKEIGTRPQRKDLNEWIKKSWDSIPVEMVRNTW
jgi:hypothetical protein